MLPSPMIIVSNTLWTQSLFGDNETSLVLWWYPLLIIVAGKKILKNARL